MFVGMFFGGWGKSESLGGSSQLEFQRGFLSLDFVLSDEALSLACPRESTQRERHPEHSSADADALRSSPIRGARNSEFYGAGKPTP
jgi:hypothetical protein